MRGGKNYVRKFKARATKKTKLVFDDGQTQRIIRVLIIFAKIHLQKIVLKKSGGD